MALTKILIDSSFLFALYYTSDVKHDLAKTVIQASSSEFTIPYITLTEAAFLFNRQGGVPAVMDFLAALITAQPIFEATTTADLSRAREIMGQYQTAKLDFVDCCIMAASERLNITKICTFDRRDFSIFRPKHCAFLEILP
jgi:predicted nucleic acid-binding protein